MSSPNIEELYFLKYIDALTGRNQWDEDDLEEISEVPIIPEDGKEQN